MSASFPGNIPPVPYLRSHHTIPAAWSYLLPGEPTPSLRRLPPSADWPQQHLLLPEMRRLCSRFLPLPSLLLQMYSNSQPYTLLLLYSGSLHTAPVMPTCLLLTVQGLSPPKHSPHPLTRLLPHLPVPASRPDPPELFWHFPAPLQISENFLLYSHLCSYPYVRYNIPPVLTYLPEPVQVLSFPEHPPLSVRLLSPCLPLPALHFLSQGFP